jgi:hypothetical protein
VLTVKFSIVDGVKLNNLPKEKIVSIAPRSMSLNESLPTVIEGLMETPSENFTVT